MCLSFKNIIFLFVISASILIAQSGTVKPLTDKAIKEYQNGNDGKIELISNKKAFVRYHDSEKQGEISMLASSTTVAVVYGNNVTLRELKNYAKLFKFSEISKIK